MKLTGFGLFPLVAHPERIDMSLAVDESRVQQDTPTFCGVPASLQLYVELRRRAATAPKGVVAVKLNDLAVALGRDRSTIRRGCRQLERCGYISTTGSGARYTPNTFRVLK